jgi:citrate synthase
MNEDIVHTRIWHEEPEPDNAFAARTARCRGYDVYGEMLGRARWVDMLFLLLRGEAPSAAQAQLLETLAVALANAGPRDPAVHAAMCAGVGGSVAAASLMAALAVGAGQYTGAREVFLAMQDWAHCGTDLARWRERLVSPPATPVGVWSAPDHAPGFDPHGTRIATTVRQALEALARIDTGPHLPWLVANRTALQACTGLPLAMTGVAAAALHALGMDADEGEMLYLLLRLPGAAAHALEQRRIGHKRFPFFRLDLLDDPASKARA